MEGEEGEWEKTQKKRKGREKGKRAAESDLQAKNNRTCRSKRGVCAGVRVGVGAGE